MKNKLQSSFGLFSFLFVAISIFSSCSTTMLSERGTAGNWPARSNAKNSSKPVITSLSSIPNESKLNSVADNSVNPSTQVLEKLGQIGPVKIDKPQTVETELPSQETIKPINSRAETFLGNRKLSSNSPNSNDKVFLKRHLNKYKSNHSQLKKPGFTENLNTKQSVIPNSDSDILKWILFGLGVILLLWIGGYGFIRFILPIGNGASLIIAISLFVACLVPGLFYLWASHLYDGLENHSGLYRIGFWGTITLLPAIFALPIWIFAALRDSVKSGDANSVRKLFANFFAWYFLILGEAFALLVTIATIAISGY